MPFAWIALAGAVGVMVADGIHTPVWVGWVASVVLFGAALFTLFAEKKGWRISRLAWRLPGTRLPASFLPFICLLGFALYQSSQPSIASDSLLYYADRGQAVTLSGAVAEPPEMSGNSSRVVISAREFTAGTARYSTSSRVQLTLPASTSLRYGERVVVTGIPVSTRQGAENKSYQRSLAARRIYIQLSNPDLTEITPASGFSLAGWLFDFRDRSLGLVKQIFPAPESGLIIGILLGPRGDIPAEIYQAFKDTGTSHLIAISGFNMAVLAGFVTSLCLRLLGKWRGAAVTVSALALYSVLVGGSASVVRAAIMASLSILAALLGRKQAGVNTLCLAGTVMLAFNPAVLWDVGFQLSFTATLGLIWFGNPLTENFKSAAGRWLPSACLEKTARIVGDYLLLTLAAQLTTFPLLLYYFHQLPLASLLANPLVLPAQPPLMILTGLAVLLGHVWLPLGNLVAWAALPFASYTLLVVDWLAGLRLPGIWLPRTSVISIAAYYGLLTALVYWKPLREKMKTLFRPLVGLGLAVLAAYLACLALAEKPDGRLHIYLAGGDEQGAVLVASPTGRYVLLGSGDDSPALLQFTGQRTPRLASALDALVLDGRDPASLRAAALALTQLRPAAIYLPESAAAAGSLNTLRAAAGEIGVEIQTLTIGTVLNLGDGAVLKTEYGNAAGSAYRLEWQGFSMALYPPETACETKSALVVLSADRWSCPQYQPALSIQLAGDGQAEPGTINLTARGWVHIQTDGTRYWVETER